MSKIIAKKEVSHNDKRLWNEAVLATCKEILKYDGLIPEITDRSVMFNAIYKKVAYKTKSRTTTYFPEKKIKNDNR